MVPAHRIEAVIVEDGKLLLDELPFQAGQAVQVIVLPVYNAVSSAHPLRGTVLRYERPTEPVAAEDWSVLQ